MLLSGPGGGHVAAGGRVVLGSGAPLAQLSLPLALREPGKRLAFEPISTRHPEKMAALLEHYPGSKGPPYGKKQGFRIWEDGQHRGWFGVGEPSFALGARRSVGRNPKDRANTVNNYMYRLDAPGERKASEILNELIPEAEERWIRRYGPENRIEHWETMVDPAAVKSQVPGASYRRAGFRSLGPTSGLSFRRPAGHGQGSRIRVPGTQKLVLYRGPLDRVPKSERERIAADLNDLFTRDMQKWLRDNPGLPNPWLGQGK